MENDGWERCKSFKRLSRLKLPTQMGFIWLLNVRNPSAPWTPRTQAPGQAPNPGPTSTCT